MNPISLNYSRLLANYDVEKKDPSGGAHQPENPHFLETMDHDRGRRGLDTEIDDNVRILDRSGKGNTKDSEAVARAMIGRGAWRRMFNEIKATKPWPMRSTMSSRKRRPVKKRRRSTTSTRINQGLPI